MDVLHSNETRRQGPPLAKALAKMKTCSFLMLSLQSNNDLPSSIFRFQMESGVPFAKAWMKMNTHSFSFALPSCDLQAVFKMEMGVGGRSAAISKTRTKNENR